MKNKMSLFFLLSLLSINLVFSEIYPLKKISTNIKTLHRKRRTLSGKEDSFLENVYGDSHNLYYYYATLYLGKKKKFLKLIYWTQEVLQLLLLVTNVVHVASI